MEEVDSDSFSDWSTLRQSFEGENITGPTYIGEKLWCHTQLHNFAHNLPMCQVVVGGGVSPHGPTNIPPPTTTRHMGELWAKLCN